MGSTVVVLAFSLIVELRVGSVELVLLALADVDVVLFATRRLPEGAVRLPPLTVFPRATPVAGVDADVEDTLSELSHDASDAFALSVL